MKISVGSGRAVAGEGVTGAALSKRRQMGCDGSPLVPLLATSKDGLDLRGRSWDRTSDPSLVRLETRQESCQLAESNYVSEMLKLCQRMSRIVIGTAACFYGVRG